MSADYPGAGYKQAKGYTRGRPDGPPLWIVIHTMEVGESSTAAEGTANYFANPDRNVSAHLNVDNNSAVQSVRVSDSAWTVGNRIGNNRGVNYELAGRAGQGEVGWADTYSRELLRRAASFAAVDVIRFRIPVRFLTVAQLRNRDKGFTTHNDLRLAFGGTTHWDPGPTFPFSAFLDLVRAEVAKLTPQQPKDDDMTPEQADQLAATTERVNAMVWDADDYESSWAAKPESRPNMLKKRFDKIDAELREVREVLNDIRSALTNQQG